MVGIFTHISAFLTVLGKRFQDKAKGATAVEYGIMVAAIAVVVIVAAIALGDQVVTLFESITTSIGARI